MEQGVPRLVVIAPAIGPEVRALIGANAGRASFPYIIALSLQVSDESHELLEDLAAYCGTRVVSRDAGETLTAVKPFELGAVRRAWFFNDELGLVAAGAPDLARERSRLLRARLALCTDDAKSAALGERVARLDGRSAVLAIPGLIGAQSEELMSRVRAAVRIAQVVLRDGVTTGGGAALVQAAARAERAGELSDPVGRALLSAVAEPLRRIASGAGLEPSTVVERTRTAAPGSRLDVERGCWLDAADVDRLLDPLAVLRCALKVAVSTASTVLTAATLVRSAQPQMSLEP
jgi:chaperonin GroEL